MDRRQPGEGAAASAGLQVRQHIQRTFEDFPGPVAVADLPPADTVFRWRAENMDGRPWSLDAVYRRAGKDVLVIRTVRGSLDWQPVFETIETLRSKMIDEREPPPVPEVEETATSVQIDGVPLPATRIDHADRSGVHIEWRGQLVFCIGDPQLIDTLRVRAATSFAEYETDAADS